MNDIGHAEDAYDRHDVVEEIVIELEQRRVDGTRRCNQQQRVTIWGCPHFLRAARWTGWGIFAKFKFGWELRELRGVPYDV
jgi:hypothetical protein